MTIYKKCIPDQYVKSIYDIDYQNLKQQGISTLLFDLDNTIIDYDHEVLDQESLFFLNELIKSFKVLVISNSRKGRVSKAVGAHFPYVSFAKKPLKFGFKKALRKLKSKAYETVVIGDQLMTDVFGAKRMNMQVILVEAVMRQSDKIWTRFNRKFEKRILKKIKRKKPEAYQRVLKDYAEKYFD